MKTIVSALCALAWSTAVAADPTPLMVVGQASPTELAHLLVQVRAAVGPVAPQTHEALFPAPRDRHGAGGLWVLGTDHVFSCGNNRSGVADVERALKEADDAILELNLEMGDFLLTDLMENQYPCLQERLPAEVLWKHYVLWGIAKSGLAVSGQADEAAVAMFGWAHRVFPNQPWDEQYPPRAGLLYERARAGLLEQRLEALQQAADRPFDATLDRGDTESLTVNGVAPPPTLAPGSYLLQWSRDGSVQSRVVQVREEVGVSLFLVSVEGWAKALTTLPQDRSTPQALTVEATVRALAKSQSDLVVVVSGAHPVALVYRLTTGVTPTPVALEPLPVEEADETEVPDRVRVERVRMPPPRLAVHVGGLVQAASLSLYGGGAVAGELRVVGGNVGDLWVGLGASAAFTRWREVPYGLMSATASVAWSFTPHPALSPFVTVRGALEVAPKPTGAILAGGGLEVVLSGPLRLRLEVLAGAGGRGDRANVGRAQALLGVCVRAPSTNPL